MSADGDSIRDASRSSSFNERVDTGSPTIIRNGKQSALIVQNRFINRTEHDHYCPKFRYWKSKSGEFLDGYPAEFSLTHEEAVALHATLAEGLTIAESRERGRYLTLRLDGGTTSTEGQDPLEIARALLPLLRSAGVIEGIRSLPESGDLLAGIELAARVAELESAIEELESMLDEGVYAEDRYQIWCEKHWWALGPVYIARDEVRLIARGDSVDLLMERTANGLRDVIELKRPNMPVVSWDKTHKSFYWSSDTNKAIGQCHRYLDALHEGASNGLRDNPEIVAYHPRARIIIGRSVDWPAENRRQLHGLNARLHGISVTTFDDLLNQSKQTLAIIRQKARL